MSLLLDQPQAVIDTITTFLSSLYKTHGKTKAVVAVSGGIDSSLSVTLATRALTPANVIPVFLPYGQQSVDDARAVVAFNQIPQENWVQYDIQSLADGAATQLGITPQDQVRRGNVMARMRMVLLFDVAKRFSALVCGTENKSEKYLGYFTRFGDEASDVEPIQHLYKTQVRQLSKHLGIPEQIITKPPSAGLWEQQTDEQELGFTYEVADKVLEQLVDQGVSSEMISIEGVDAQMIQLVIAQVKRNQFKHHVPYTIEEKL